MRRAWAGIAFGVAVVAAAAIGGPAGASQQGLVRVSVPLPLLNADSITSFTVRGKATGRISMTTLNSSKLGNESIVYISAGPKKSGTVGKYTFYVLVKRFDEDRSVASAADGSMIIGIRDFERSGSSAHFVLKDQTGDCPVLLMADNAFENGNNTVTRDPTLDELGEVTLYAGRPKVVQSSNPEEVVDQIVSDLWHTCPGSPEPFDSGSK